MRRPGYEVSLLARHDRLQRGRESDHREAEDNSSERRGHHGHCRQAPAWRERPQSPTHVNPGYEQLSRADKP